MLVSLLFLLFSSFVQSLFLTDNYNLSLTKPVPNHNILCFTRLYGVTYITPDNFKYKGLQLEKNSVPLPVIVGLNNNIQPDAIVNSGYFTLWDGIVFNQTIDYCKELEEFVEKIVNSEENVRNLSSRSLLGRFIFKRVLQEPGADKPPTCRPINRDRSGL